MEKKLKIGIVSLGLIGGSILKALYAYKKYDFYCCSTSYPEKAFKYTKNISDNLEIVKECDIIFVCSPISKTLEILNKLNNILKPNCIVADCASVKKELLDKKFSFDFILSHPMAGKEKTGFNSSDKNLFQGAKWLIGKHNKTLENIIKKLGAKPYLIDMQNHDYICAQISHLPMFLAYSLFLSADNISKQFASSGFRDMTRLASNPLMSVDMLELNKENIEAALNNITEKLNYLKNLSYNEKIKVFKDISLQREKMYNKQGKNVFKP